MDNQGHSREEEVVPLCWKELNTSKTAHHDASYNRTMTTTATPIFLHGSPGFIFHHLASHFIFPLQRIASTFSSSAHFISFAVFILSINPTSFFSFTICAFTSFFSPFTLIDFHFTHIFYDYDYTYMPHVHHVHSRSRIRIILTRLMHINAYTSFHTHTELAYILILRYCLIIELEDS